MSALPPTLLYLTIYNPSLRPSQPVPDDDEDAEEQSQILFYTSRERAVSRDRILRQVGLAKALVNFSGYDASTRTVIYDANTSLDRMFSTDEGTSNVHSQMKRMIMVSPEPNFWIHAVCGSSISVWAGADDLTRQSKWRELPKHSPTSQNRRERSVIETRIRALRRMLSPDTTTMTLRFMMLPCGQIYWEGMRSSRCAAKRLELSLGFISPPAQAWVFCFHSREDWPRRARASAGKIFYSMGLVMES
jgi:hypothetical protein